jgi:hypothetical protein
LTGYFQKGPQGARSAIDRIEQSSCDSITFGLLIVENGVIKEEMFPLITYFNKDRPNLCRDSVCQKFESTEELVKLFYNGSIEIKTDSLAGKTECYYSAVTYSLTPENNLRQTYTLDTYGEDDPCSKVDTYSEEFLRTSRP